MCEEAWPVEGIKLTGLYDLTGLSREQMIFDKAKLLSVFDMTKDAEPMRTGNPTASPPVTRHHAPPSLRCPPRPGGPPAPGPVVEPASAAAIPASSPQGPTP